MIHATALVLLSAAACFISSVSSGSVCSFGNKVCVELTDNGDDTLTFDVNSTTTGWVSIGWNDRSGMRNADMLVMWYSSTNQPIVSDRYATSSSLPSADASQDATDVSGTQIGSVKTWSFQRKKSTGDARDRDLTSNPDAWIFAWGNDQPTSDDPSTATFRYHVGTWTPPDLDLFATGDQTTDLVDHEPGVPPKSIHGILMFFAWNVLVPGSILIARFFKKEMGVWWFRLHWSLNTLAIVFMLAALVVMVKHKSGDGEDHFTSPHGIVGLLTLVLVVFIQMPLGVYIDRMFNVNRTSIPVRDKTHWYLGFIVFLFSLLAMSIGIVNYTKEQSGILVAYFVYVALLVLTFSVLAFTKSVHHHVATALPQAQPYMKVQL